jgi:hypothetical protein
MGGGGFTPGLKRTDWALTGGATHLASEKYIAKRSGVTIDATTVSADSDGNKIVKAGTFVVPIGGVKGAKYQAYTGTGTVDPDTSGYTFESVNCRDGDVICGILIQGSVYRFRVTPSSIDAATKTATAGRIIYQ